MRRSRTIFLLLAILLLSTSLFADDTAELRQQMKLLMERLEKQEADLQQLRSQQADLLQRLDRAASPPVAATTSEAAPVPAEPQRAEHAVISPSAAAQTGMAGSEHWWKGEHLTIGGYGSFRFEANDVPDNQFIPGGSANSFTFRRFVVTTDSHITDRLRIYSETELERLLELELDKGASRQAGGVKFSNEVEGNSGAEIGVEQLWAQFDLGKGQAIRGGLILPPLGRFNILHDDDYWDVPRRTLVDRNAPVVPVKTAWRELGLGLVGSLPLGASTKLDYQMYLMNGSTLDFNLESVVQTRTPSRNKLEMEAELGMTSGAVDGTRNASAFAWRAALSPSLAGEIALSGYHGAYTPTWISGNELVNSLAVDGKWRFGGGFEVEGEAVYSSFGDIRQTAQTLAEAIYHSSAETSSAETADLESEIEVGLGGLPSRRFGFWTDLKYHWRPQWLRKSFLGRGFEDPQLIPIVRYERVWLWKNVEELAFTNGLVTDLALQDLEQDRVTLGVNYRPTQQFGFQLAYEHNQRRRGDHLIFPNIPQQSTNGLLLGWTFSF